MFILINDPNQGRCVHFQSDPKKNIMDYFNEKCHREFFTNNDYLQMGGRRDDLPKDLLQAQNEEYETQGGPPGASDDEEPVAQDDSNGSD